MKQTAEHTDGLGAELAEEMLAEIQRYLGAIQLFRELEHEPVWLAEAHSSDLGVRSQAQVDPCESRVSAA
jgi:hypothetical protein